MALRRHVQPPSANYSPRPSLGSEKFFAIDSVLKQLKACSRRLQAALASHRTELQVLERLYYKGKNQHRTALFWQRVAEMRKFGERVDEMHMDDVVESLRLSFWGEPSGRTTKTMKGPWTHYPDAKPLLFVLERCSACCMLIDRARERLLGIYESFTLMMQTGAFLQMMVILAAIASRMRLLMVEVRAALEVSWSACYRALQTIFPSEAQTVKVLPRNVDTDAASSDVASSVPQSRALSSVPTPIETHEEDLGDTMSRPVQRATLTQEQSRVATVSVSEPPLLPRDDDVMDAGAFSLATELRTEPIG
ncbi:hypothetical protein OH76DRAFT_1336277 [Lentinus brumalis]|uniref:Nucleolus and neural progenitor protein-like N-terminal domain-containing protein n=1 Tax=Lentinus brumalis TaxID=2498619 RepID=A0A371DWJ8_9APHY|nr:hypothetical protein OH76DRAFT_1336277 [Polyporus brumalis]